MSPDEIVSRLEAEAMHYEFANNSATNSSRYKRQDSDYWRMAAKVREMAEALRAIDAMWSESPMPGWGYEEELAAEAPVGACWRSIRAALSD